MDPEIRIATILGQLNGVRRYSGGHMALCPAHRDTNVSLSVRGGRDGRILLKCFTGCGVEEIMSALGMPMKLLFANRGKKTERAPRKENMASTYTTEDEEKVRKTQRLYSKSTHLAGTPGAQYLAGRGIPTNLANSNGARYHPSFPFRLTNAPAVVLPIYSGDQSGKLVGLSARFLNPERDTNGEKQRSSGKPSWGLFGTRGVVNCSEVVIAEAPIDAPSLAAAGIPAFATCGASNLRNFPKLFGGKTIICAFDLDSEPMTQTKMRNMMDRLKDEHAGRVVWLKPPGNGLKDWNDVLQKYGPTGLAHYIRQAGAKCRPPVLTWLGHGDMVKPTSTDPGEDVVPDTVGPGTANRGAVAESSAVQDQPAQPCYCCKSRKWWFQKASRSWVCAVCHPDPRA